jgi:hypothetical protein
LHNIREFHDRPLQKILKHPAWFFWRFFWLYEKASAKTISKVLLCQKRTAHLPKKLDFY